MRSAAAARDAAGRNELHACGERVELLCIDEASDDAPLLLEDGRWLSNYALPHEEKKVFAFRLSCSAASVRGVPYPKGNAANACLVHILLMYYCSPIKACTNICTHKYDWQVWVLICANSYRAAAWARHSGVCRMPEFIYSVTYSRSYWKS